MCCPYPKAEFDRSLKILTDYDLLTPDTSFSQLVDNRALAGAAAAAH